MKKREEEEGEEGDASARWKKNADNGKNSSARMPARA